jgi:Flp pilus assembly protein TadG
MAGRRHLLARRRRDRGASAVEFALILPVFVLIIAAIVDFGFIFAQQVSLNNAARDASRTGVVKPLAGNPRQCQQVVTDARGAMTNTLGLSSTTAVSVNVAGNKTCNAPAGSTTVSGSPTEYPCTGGAANQTVTVTLTYTSQALIPLPYLNSKVLSAKGVFQCEYS